MSPLISGTQVVAPIVRANLKAERTAESRRLIVAGAKPASCMAARHASRWLLPSPSPQADQDLQSLAWAPSALGSRKGGKVLGIGVERLGERPARNSL